MKGAIVPGTDIVGSPYMKHRVFQFTRQKAEQQLPGAGEREKRELMFPVAEFQSGKMRNFWRQ